MTVNEFLDEFLDPKFQEMMKIVEKVLEEKRMTNEMVQCICGTVIAVAFLYFQYRRMNDDR
jgi:hypothetical protein